MAVKNCVTKLEMALPMAIYLGINIKFKARLMQIPVIAIRLSCFKLPLAVNNVPKIYVEATAVKQNIKMPNSIAESVTP